jgi:hypothetical protein
MYTVVTWEIENGAPQAVADEAAAVLGGRVTCDLYGGVRIARVESETDFLRLHEALRDLSDRHAGLFRFAVWALRAGSPMRTNVTFDQGLALEVISG